jgi:RNA polymerase sigma-70 factor (ECF subfamily)
VLDPDVVLINGTIGIVTAPEGTPVSAMSITVREGKIVAIDLLADPERLRQLDLTTLND